MDEASGVSAKIRGKLGTIFIFAVMALAITARLMPGARTIDDAYITFRYARNILAGNGFVYNPGERVLGTTTPLYTILLALVGYFTGGERTNFPVVAMMINALADTATCVLLYFLGRYLRKPYTGLGTALVWAIAPFSVTFAIGGLETSLYTFLLVSFSYTYIRSHYYWSALLGALALLTRPDALLLILPASLDRFFSFVKSPENAKAKDTSSRWLNLAIEAIILMTPIAVWEAFAINYFGNPLPNSITAKSVAYLLPEKSAFIRLLQHYATPFLGHLTFGTPWIGVGLVVYPFLYLIGARRTFSKNKNILPLALFPWLYFLAFSIANPLIFRWYLTPPLPALQFFILAGVESIVEDGFTLMKKPSSTLHLMCKRFTTAFFVILFPFILIIRGWTMHPDHGIQNPAPEMAWYLLELKYRQAADYLLARFSQSNLAHLYLAAGDVGVLGYYTYAKILDTVGLNSPVAIQYYPLEASQHVNAYAVPTRLILDEKPDVIVLLEVYGRKSLFQEPQFWEEYELIHQIPTDIYGSNGMLIFQRKDTLR